MIPAFRAAYALHRVAFTNQFPPSTSTNLVVTTMASSAHPTFPSRPYGTNLGKLPDRSLGAFGSSITAQQREAQRLERERERLDKERIEREGQAQLTQEQQEEIREAVRDSMTFQRKGADSGRYDIRRIDG